MSLSKSGTELGDMVSLAVFCKIDSTFMLTVENNEHWIPSTKVPQGHSWEKTISKDLVDMFKITHPDKIARLWKIWIPRQTESIFHCVYQNIVDSDEKNRAKNTMGKYRGKLRWVTETELIKLTTSNSLRSPELLDIFYLVRDGTIHDRFVPSDEFIGHENFFETCQELLSPGKPGPYSQLVDASGIDKLGGQEALLIDFITLTFPANYMNFRIFCKVLTDLGWSKELLPHAFRAADMSNRNGLSFRDYLYFLSAVDPVTVHGGVQAELRCKYMFRYYDRDRDNLLKTEDFKALILDLRKTKKLTIDAPSVTKEASETLKLMGMGDSASVSLMEFLKAICDLKIKGTSNLLRSPNPIMRYVKDLGIKEVPKSGAAPAANVPAKPGPENVRGKMTAPSLRQQPQLNYEVAVHTVRIQKSGNAINIDEMKQLQGNTRIQAVSMTTLKQPYNEQTRKLSMDIFSQRSVSNELLKGLRYLASINKTKDLKANFTWGQLDPNTYARNLITVCNQVREIFKVEPRLLELSSPIYIMGDFHGNVADLLYFERTLWHIGPGLNPCGLLFLGDYVDRGAYSIEVISYLLAYKLQYPSKLNLLRGNHEIREVQKMFTFYKECILKLGDKLGSEVWMSVNNAFDTMPIAATIDGKLFCCHGGIPPPWLCPAISAINDIPVPLNQPDTQSSLAWELMWNDPVRPKTVNDKLTMELLANEGFAVNARRGTAHIFSVEALERFLKTNQLTHLVRAHEVAQAGFQVQQKGKLLTVFSSSKYCGGQNDAACVMVDQGKLRILRLETD
ncbi:uncharacterized protein LOC108912646 [Anoplophora glabripennis]|uniref:uncharacterized protein LOC108912646 n=1 Tax=Anoplophora glabripennis TaxID=217634 RepID=UPI000C765498|nr:uncharacterized protein LOC108912646 [Anoplophora glabripennis]